MQSVCIPTLACAALTVPSAAAPGDPDFRFGFDDQASAPGTVVTPIFNNTNTSVSALAVQNDGKILVAGSVGSFLCFVRYLEDGRMDPAFGAGAEPLTLQMGFTVIVTGMALQADGKILLTGRINQSPSGNVAFVMRFLPNGLPDNSFGTTSTGWITFGEAGWSTTAAAAAVLADGKILIAGSESQEWPGTGSGTVIYRYQPNGTPDPSFGVQGRAAVAGAQATSMSVQADGKILVGATRITGSGVSSFWLARCNANGTLDPNFGNFGILSVPPPPGGSMYLRGLAVLSDGKILAAGNNEDESHRYDFTVMRFLPDGSSDPSFYYGTGKVVTDLSPLQFLGSGNSTDLATAFAVQPDGKLLLAGHTYDQFALVRYLPDGEPDHGFGKGGTGMIKTAVQAGRCRITAMALQPDGKIVAGGNSNANANPVPFHVAVARYMDRDPLRDLVVEWPPGKVLPYGGVVELGSVLQSGLSERQTTLTLRNTGGIPLTGITAALSGASAARFGIVSPPAQTVADGAATTLTVRFNPEAQLTSRSAVLTIKTGRADLGELSLILHGSTDGPVATLSLYEHGLLLAPGFAVDFGPAVAAPGNTRVFTVRNTGNLDLTLQGISFGSTGNPGDFIAGAPETDVLAGNEFTSFPVTFSPAGPGPRTATLRIASTDTFNPPYEITLWGKQATGLEAWRLTHFTTAVSDGDAADLSDPDHDGLSNLLEYATLSSPLQPGITPGQIETIDHTIKYTIVRPTSAMTELFYTMEWSEDLSGAWSTAGVTETVVSDTGTQQQVQFHTPAAGNRRLLRLRVTRR